MDTSLFKCYIMIPNPNLLKIPQNSFLLECLRSLKFLHTDFSFMHHWPICCKTLTQQCSKWNKEEKELKKKSDSSIICRTAGELCSPSQHNFHNTILWLNKVQVIREDFSCNLGKHKTGTYLNHLILWHAEIFSSDTTHQCIHYDKLSNDIAVK